MTILANEATRQSQALLKKYNKSNAQSYSELEMKLAELYFEPKMDKIVLEKELAEIHPHKKWLVRTLELDKKADDEEEVKDEAGKMPKVIIKKSCHAQVCEDENCKIHGEKSSSFSGNSSSDSKKTSNSNIEIIGLVGVIGLISLTFIIVSKNIK